MNCRKSTLFQRNIYVLYMSAIKSTFYSYSVEPAASPYRRRNLCRLSKISRQTGAIACSQLGTIVGIKNELAASSPPRCGPGSRDAANLACSRRLSLLELRIRLPPLSLSIALWALVDSFRSISISRIDRAALISAAMDERVRERLLPSSYCGLIIECVRFFISFLHAIIYTELLKGAKAIEYTFHFDNELSHWKIRDIYSCY